MRVLKNYLWNVLYQLFAILIPIITIPYISRVLGPYGVGVNSYTSSIAQYFILFGTIGVNLYGNRKIAYTKKNPEDISNVFWEIFLMQFCTVMITALIFVLLFGLTSGKFKIYFLAQFVLIAANAFDISWFFMGMENFRVTVVKNFIVKLLSLGLIFLLVRSPNDILLYILINGFSTLAGNLTFFPYLKQYVDKPRIKELKIFRHLKPAITLFIPQIAAQIYVVLNRTVLGKMVSVEASGYYDNSDKIIKVLLAITTALGSVMLPHIANEFSKKHYKKVKKMFQISFDFVSFINIPMALGIMSISSKFVLLFFGERFGPVSGLMSLEAFASLFMSWAYAIGNQYLLPTDQVKSYTKAVTGGAIVSICTNVPLIYLFGVNGAMYATILAEVSVSTIMLFSIKRQIKISDMFKNVPKYTLSSLVMGFVVYKFDKILNTSWRSILIEVLVGIFVYVVMTFITKPSILNHILLVRNKKGSN